MLSIRNIIKQDKEQIYSLIDAVNEHNQLGYSLTDEWFDYVVNEAGEHIFVAVDTSDSDNSCETACLIVSLATCMIDHVSQEFAQINILVHPKYRRRGIGTAMYDKIIMHLKDFNRLNCKQVSYLELIVKKRLNESLKFAEKRGFRPVMYSWEMQKTLNAENIRYNQNYTLVQVTDDDTLACKNYIDMMYEIFGHQVDEVYYKQIFQDSSIKLYFLINNSTNEVVGMIAMQLRETTKTVYLFDIGIRECYRGQGLGKLMIQQAIDIILQNNYQFNRQISYQIEDLQAAPKEPRWQKVALVVDGINKTALSLYHKLGFREIDEEVIMSNHFE